MHKLHLEEKMTMASIRNIHFYAFIIIIIVRNVENTIYSSTYEIYN